MKKTLSAFMFISILLHMPNAFSWNAVGHRLIAQIAYTHLTRHAKIRFNRYNRHVDDGYMSNSMVNASTWLDTIRYRVHDYDALHYIDIPFSTDGTPLPAIVSMNAVQAVNQSIALLLNPDLSYAKKGKALRILLHVVGDLHQPMHAVTRVSRDYPQGDRGGNDVRLHHNRVANNLHAYWDKGAGLFVSQRRRLGPTFVKRQAVAIALHWPCYLNDVDLNAMHWAQESHALAVQTAYRLRPQEQLIQNQEELRAAQRIVEQRIALAGCRLAGLLNHIDLESPLLRDLITAPKNRVASPPVTAR